MTFNHHQSSDMEIIIQITILKLNSLTDRALTYTETFIGTPGLFHEAFSECEQHHKALQEEKKLPGPEQLTWIGLLFPGTPEEQPTVLTTGPSNSVNPISVCTYYACSFNL